MKTERKLAEFHSKTAKYFPIEAHLVPQALIWSGSAILAGEANKVEYGEFGRSGFEHGSPYKKVTSTDIGPGAVQYYEFREPGM